MGGARSTVVDVKRFTRPKPGLRAALVDGTAAVAVGGVLAGGFGVESVKSVLTAEPVGRWGLIVATVAGFVLIAAGLVLRQRSFVHRIGIVVTAESSARGSSRAVLLGNQAEAYSRRAHEVTLAVKTGPVRDAAQSRQRIIRLADRTLGAVATAETLLPEATQICLVPTMPLHDAFWFGARLGHAHAREIVVCALRQADGQPAYFSAVPLRERDTLQFPLADEGVEAVETGTECFPALVVDLQSRGAAFDEQVRTAGKRYGVTHRLRLRSRNRVLPENTETFTAVVDQICAAWRDGRVPPARRCGLFINGPVAITLALGARLASADPGRWHIFAYDGAAAEYTPVPAIEPGQNNL